MEVFNVEDVTANDVIQKNIAKEKKRNLSYHSNNWC